MHHFVRNYNDWFGIHANTRTVFTFMDIGILPVRRVFVCTWWYLVRIIHTQRRDSDKGGSMILVA